MSDSTSLSDLIGVTHNENCLDTMSRMPDSCVDLVVTSPPYDALRQYSGGYEFDFDKTAPELYRVIEEGGVVVWIVGDQTVNGTETGTSMKQALTFKEIGFNIWDTMIYLKSPQGAVGNNKTYWQSWEYMFVLSKGHPKTINLICDRPNKESRKQDRGTKRLANGKLEQTTRGGYGEFGRRTNVWYYKTGQGHSSKNKIAYEHPAIFPEQLAADHILSWSNEGDTVYDPFMGSGTVAKMSTLLQRNWIGSEVSQEYCLIAQQRLEEAKHQCYEQGMF